MGALRHKMRADRDIDSWYEDARSDDEPMRFKFEDARRLEGESPRLLEEEPKRVASQSPPRRIERKYDIDARFRSLPIQPIDQERDYDGGDRDAQRRRISPRGIT